MYKSAVKSLKAPDLQTPYNCLIFIGTQLACSTEFYKTKTNQQNQMTRVFGCPTYKEAPCLCWLLTKKSLSTWKQLEFWRNKLHTAAAVTRKQSNFKTLNTTCLWSCLGCVLQSVKDECTRARLLEMSLSNFDKEYSSIISFCRLMLTSWTMQQLFICGKSLVIAIYSACCT